MLAGWARKLARESTHTTMSIKRMQSTRQPRHASELLGCLFCVLHGAECACRRVLCTYFVQADGEEWFFHLSRSFAASQLRPEGDLFGSNKAQMRNVELSMPHAAQMKVLPLRAAANGPV